MSPRTKAILGTSQTLRAAREFNRRAVLGRVAAGAVAALGPWVLTSAAKAAGKELKIMVWSGYIPRALKDSFESRTGELSYEKPPITSSCSSAWKRVPTPIRQVSFQSRSMGTSLDWPKTLTP